MIDSKTHDPALSDNKRENYNVPGYALRSRDDLSLAIERESLNLQGAPLADNIGYLTGRYLVISRRLAPWLGDGAWMGLSR